MKFKEINKRFSFVGSVASIILNKKPKKDDRMAKCMYCKTMSVSHDDLPFFNAKPEVDEYYCGCKGWD